MKKEEFREATRISMGIKESVKSNILISKLLSIDSGSIEGLIVVVLSTQRPIAPI